MDAITTESAWMRPALGGGTIAHTDINTHQQLIDVIKQHRDLARLETKSHGTGLYQYDRDTGEIEMLDVSSKTHPCDIGITKNDCVMKGKAISARMRALKVLERRKAMK